MSRDQKSESLVKIGKIIDAHSLTGEVKVFLAAGEAPWIGKLKKIYFSATDAHEVQRARLASAGRLILKIKGVEDRTAAEKLKGREVFAEQKLFASRKGENLFLRELLGFAVYDQGRYVGSVQGFDFNGQQDLLEVRVDRALNTAPAMPDSPTGDKVTEAILIPLIKEFIVRIDDAGKKIEMILPEGLTEVNKSGD